MFNNIPEELRGYKSWVNWRLEWRGEGNKPTKVPYSVRGFKASVTDPVTWTDFATAVAMCPFPNYSTSFDPALPVSQTGFSGIGFVLSKYDPFDFIDLDDCHGDEEAYATQVRIYQELNSYSEYSPSGTGLHIVAKGGNFILGRRRHHIELYSTDRFMTMTGNVFNPAPIAERSEALHTLYKEMGAPPLTNYYDGNAEQKHSDHEILQIATAAGNGEKFLALHNGQWDHLYQSQSEADFAYIDILAFYTQNREQLARMFRASILGSRAKARRNNYVNYMIDKSFDRQLPPLDLEGLKINGEAAMQIAAKATADTLAATGSTSSPSQAQPEGANEEIKVLFPPGLVGEIARYIYEAAPRPIPILALAGAIGLVAGVTGRAFNFNGQGLNQYILVIAETGSGKEAIASGISQLIGHIKPSISAASEFVGPGEIASPQGITKWLATKPSCVSIIGEFGLKMKEMSNPRANAYTQAILRFLTQIYTKSGMGFTLDPTAYSDQSKNTPTLFSPAFSLIGDSTPDFYNVIDEAMVKNGLLPRCSIFEYFGKSPYLSKSYKEARPSFALVEGLSALMAQCLSLHHSNTAHLVQATPEAQAMLDQYDIITTDRRNNVRASVIKQLWNRAHLKVQKLSATIAVGINYINPVVSVDDVQWSIDLVEAEVNGLVRRFERGEIGNSNLNAGDDKLIEVFLNMIRSWYANKDFKPEGYGSTPQMHREYVIPHQALSIKLYQTPAFKNDRWGAGAALKRVVQHCLDSGYMVEMNKLQMMERYGTRAKAYCITDPVGMGITNPAKAA